MGLKKLTIGGIRMRPNEQGKSEEEIKDSALDSPVLEGKRGWYGDPEGHAYAGSLGGRKVSRNREYMAEIGRRGGQKVASNREHMAEIGRKGGLKGKRSRAA